MYNNRLSLPMVTFKKLTEEWSFKEKSNCSIAGKI